MSETKVRLSMKVRGAQLLSSQECEKNPKKNYNTEAVTVEFPTKKGKAHKETITVRTRKHRLVKQVLNISKEAYNSMTAVDQPPTKRLAKKILTTKVVGKEKNGKPKKVITETTVWAHQFTPIQRLNWYMSRIAESLGAVDYSFEVFDD